MTAAKINPPSAMEAVVARQCVNRIATCSARARSTSRGSSRGSSAVSTAIAAEPGAGRSARRRWRSEAHAPTRELDHDLRAIAHVERAQNGADVDLDRALGESQVAA